MIESRRRFFGPNVLELCEAADVVFLALHAQTERTERYRLRSICSAFRIPERAI